MEQIDYDRKFAALTGTPENHKLDEFIDKHYAKDIAEVDARALARDLNRDSVQPYNAAESHDIMLESWEIWKQTLNEEPPLPE